MSEPPATPAPAGPSPGPPHGPPREQPVPPPAVPTSPRRHPADNTPLPPPDLAGWLLACHPAELPGYDPAPLADPDRPPAAYHALSAALGCPDLFLADAEPGPAQLAFAADLAAEAARAGERVLVVCPTPADADAVLARLADAPVTAGRALAPGEPPGRLPPASAARTGRAHADRLLVEARSAVAAAEARLAALRAAAEVAEPLKAAADRLAGLARDRDELPARVEAESAGLRRLDDDHAAALARLDEDARKVDADLSAKRKELAELAGRHDGKKHGGVFSRLMGLFGRDEPVRPAEPDAHEVEAAVRRLEAEAARLAVERGKAEDAHRTAREALLRKEIGDRLAELDRDREAVEAEFRELATPFTAAGLPAEPVPDVPPLVEAAEAELRSAREAAAALEGRGPELVRRVVAAVRVVVAPFDAVGADVLTHGTAFDRLALTAAEHLGEDEFAHVARFASRLALVGDAAGALARARPARNGRPRPGFFPRLWRHLHRPAWVADGGRLVARLTDAAVHFREPLADRPEIELRLGRDGDGQPALAEVAFPAGMPAAVAKEFLARELGEVRLVPCGPVRWHESDGHLTACWPAAGGPGDWAELADGVREQVAGTGPGCRTAAVRFDRAAGWDRPSAEAWLADRLGPAPRAAALPRPTALAGPAAPTLAAGVRG